MVVVLIVMMLEELPERGSGDCRRVTTGSGCCGSKQRSRLVQCDRWPVGALHASTAPIIALLEHVFEFDGGVEGPIVSFALAAALSRNFDETFVEAEVVSDRVLPTLAIAFEIRKFLHDVLIYCV
jgi:hypothetical protein